MRLLGEGVFISTVCGTGDFITLCPLTGRRRVSCQKYIVNRLVHLLGRLGGARRGLLGVHGSQKKSRCVWGGEKSTHR